ncbi:MAG: TRAP transporter large permease subunit [Pseudolabrys sp.]
MEVFFIALLILLMMVALGWGFPVAFALPGAAIFAVAIASLAGWLTHGNVDAFFVQDGPSQWLTAAVSNFRSVYWDPDRDTLIAIPLFVFMGIMLQKSRIAEDLLVTMAQLFGPVRGGLGISVVFVGALLAATTGIVGATVVAMGLISLPAMMRSNYSHPLATGTIAASGTLGQIIPPSIVLIILADQLGAATDQAGTARKLLYKVTTGELTMPSSFDVTSTSAGEMFLGALVPGLLLVAVYITYILIVAALRPKSAPAVPYDGKYDLRFAGRVAMALVPPLALIFIVLGSIIMGIATVNQAGAVGSGGALIMAGYQLYQGKRGAYWPAIIALVSVAIVIFGAHYHPINVKKLSTSADVTWLVVSAVCVTALIGALVWSGLRALRIDNTLQSVMVETAKTSALVFIILMGAAMLTAVFRGFGGEELVKAFLTGLPGGFWGQFWTVMGVIFILGFFIDFIEISVVVVPIVAPILLSDPGANITAVWLGVMIGINMQTSFLTPPFGFALFYLRGVAPPIVKTISMYKGVIPFIFMQLLVLVVVAFTPRLVNYLPQRVTLGAVTAPPPINPGLQRCVEQNVTDEFKNNGTAIKAAIAKAQGLDLASLPADMRKDLVGSFVKATAAFTLLADVNKSSATIDKRAETYAPLHHRVRDIQEDIRRNQAEIKRLKDELDFLPEKTAASRKKAVAAEVATLEANDKKMKASIPADWEPRHQAFRKLLTADRIARLKYRRDVDSAYEPVRNAVRTIEAGSALKALKPELQDLRGVINSQEPKKAADTIEATMTKLGGIAGASEIRSELYHARRALIAKTPDKDAALKALDKTMATYDKDVAWRQKAAQDVLPGLKAYEAEIRDTIGLRKQPKLPHAIVPEIAMCTSHPRDISLYF